MNNTTANVAFRANALRAGYEQLRGEALDSRSGICRGFGFTLLLRAGLASWLLACRESVSASPRPAQASALSQVPAPRGLRAELAMIITAMALDNGKAKA
jgi:hypothetical protein